MDDFTLALDRVVGRTGASRLRVLTDPAHTDYNPSYRDLVRRLDAEAGGAPTTLSQGPDPDRSRDGRVRAGLWCEALLLGGAEQWQLSLVETVDPSKVRWEGVAVARQGAYHADMVRAFGRHMPVAYGREACTELASRCDVVLTWAVPNPSELLPCAGTRPRVVSVIHSPPESAWGVAHYRDTRGIDRHVCVSEHAVGSLPADVRTKAKVIWNAVNPRRLEVGRSRWEMRHSWGVPVDAPVAGYLGRLTDEKRPETMAHLARHLPADWWVVVVGSGPLSGELARLKAEHGLDRLRLVPADAGAGNVLNAFDVLVSPSDYESFGLTMGEAMWTGVPVVATDAGIARMAPGLTWPVPFRPSGEQVARAVWSIDHTPGRDDRVDAAREFAHARLAPDRFGREWTREILEAAGRKVAFDRSAVTPALLASVMSCPDRGPVLDNNHQRDGCKCGELSECRVRKGRIPGRVTLDDCLVCRSESG